MSATILTAEEAKKLNIELVASDKGAHAVHEAVVALRAARRSGSASTKTRAEVNRSGRKPWKQKGTGRARSGSAGSPVWVGGGVAFGPHPRDYSKKINKKTARLAFHKAVSSRIEDGDILIAESFTVNEPKTKQFVSLLEACAPKTRKTLVVVAKPDEVLEKAARNVPFALIAYALNLNTEQVLDYDKIIITREALAQLAERISK